VSRLCSPRLKANSRTRWYGNAAHQRFAQGDLRCWSLNRRALNRRQVRFPPRFSAWIRDRSPGGSVTGFDESFRADGSHRVFPRRHTVGGWFRSECPRNHRQAFPSYRRDHGSGSVAIAEAGSLAYVPASSVSAPRLVWVDRTGREGGDRDTARRLTPIRVCSGLDSAH